MTTDQESPQARIVPFRPRHTPQSETTAASSARTVSLDSALADQLLGIRSLADTPEGGPATWSLHAVTLGASSGAFYPHTATERVPQLASALGISTIEVMLQTPGEYAPAFIAEVAANARAAGVTIGSVHSLTQAHPMLSVYPRRAEEGLALFHRAIEATSELGARVLVWHGPERRLMASEDGWEQFVALTRDLAGACARAGVILGLENVSHGPLAQVRDVVRIASRLGEIGPAEAVGFVFDPFQAAEAGANPFMMLAAMGNRVVNVHLSDFRERDASMRHLLPGAGDLQWSALMRAIAGSGYRGPMMIEGPLGTTPEPIAQVRAYLEPMIRSMFLPMSAAADESDAPPTTLSAPPAGVLRGITLFNQREFHAQHEEIEAEWHAERGPIRRLYQGILQIGVGLHHAQRGNISGAMTLLAEGIAKVSAFLPDVLGIDTGRLVRDSQRYLDHLEAVGVGDPALIPTVHFTES